MSTEDLSAFWIFKRVVDLGSFSKAAKAEGLSNNAVGLRVQNLERRLGVQLLGRTTKKVWLTEAGKRYYKAYSKVSEELTKARDTVAGKPVKESNPGGLLRICAPSLVAARCVAPLLAALTEKNPNLDVSLMTNESEGDLDLILRFIDGEEDSTAILSGERVLLASRSYLQRFGAPKTLEKLAEHRCLWRKSEATWRLTGPKGDIEVTPKGILLDSKETLLHAVLHGVGIGLVPRFALQREASLGVVERVLPEYQSDTNTRLVASYPKGELSSPWAKLFVDYLRNQS